jgi:putative Mn2+ efflux pump MntP
MLALLLVAASLGLSNFAAAIAIGVSGVDSRTRLRVGIVFGVFEAGMPLLGLLLGHGLAGTLGHAVRWIGAALLIGTGLFALIQAFRHHGDTTSAAAQGQGKLLVSGLALSIDNLAVGFALGTYHAALLTAAVLIGAVSVTMALAGLELGRLLGNKIGERGQALGGIVLVGVGVGIAIAAGLL